jgi:ornithine carbamoyltransferase
MKNLIQLSDYSKQDILEIFQIADELQLGKYQDFLKGKTLVMFFPNSSIRTRITFERGIYLLGGQTSLFPPETLDKKEDLKDVFSYLSNWVDCAIIRHKNISLLEEITKSSNIPIINAMTDDNHPCEILTDLYSLSKIRDNIKLDNFLFVGPRGNIGLTWKQASEILGFSLIQCCPSGYDIENVNVIRKLDNAVKDIDIVCTDSYPSDSLADFKDYKISTEIMKMANEKAVLNPCPPFFRNEEVTEDVIDSEYFVGYTFKKYLLEIQQAIIIYSLSH